MPNLLKAAIAVIAVILLVQMTGCVMLSSSDVSVKNLSKETRGPKVVTILNNTPYLPELSVALTETGFSVKPMSSQEEITERQGNSERKYNRATARYGITLQTYGSSMSCAFTDYNIYHFTMTVTDITNNQVLMVFKQKGSDGPCTTVKPVFPTLADALSRNW
jgi:hypothetical protein